MTGVSTNDFTQIMSDFARTVSYEVVTKTTDFSGSETTSFATAANQSLIFFLQDNRFVFDKEGLLEVGDAYIIAPIALGIKRYDRITVDGDKYFIENVTRRVIAGVTIMDYAVLFKVA